MRAKEKFNQCGSVLEEKLIKLAMDGRFRVRFGN